MEAVRPIPSAPAFSSEAVALMGEAFDAAWIMVQEPTAPHSAASGLREQLAHYILMGARMGETSTLALAHAAVERLHAGQGGGRAFRAGAA